mmetsp:Transcript_110661/g.346165  ORF Transcript_110661/g.346165 Transcript_110661/m.346165 type:complete len:131 (-) Transcript_110661:1780-2172(-)
MPPADAAKRSPSWGVISWSLVTMLLASPPQRPAGLGAEVEVPLVARTLSIEGGGQSALVTAALLLMRWGRWLSVCRALAAQVVTSSASAMDTDSSLGGEAGIRRAPESSDPSYLLSSDKDKREAQASMPW